MVHSLITNILKYLNLVIFAILISRVWANEDNKITKDPYATVYEIYDYHLSHSYRMHAPGADKTKNIWLCGKLEVYPDVFGKVELQKAMTCLTIEF